MVWPFKRKEELKDDLAALLNIDREEISTEKMTQDMMTQLEFILKQVNEGKIILSEEKKRNLANAIRRIDKEVSLAKFHIKEVARDVAALSRMAR